MPRGNILRHALTVDVEGYFHVAAFAKNIETKEWQDWPSRVEASTQALLRLFEARQIKATFLCWVG